MDIKLFDSELKVMDVLWHRNTTYKLIKRCIKRGAIERSEPNFMCHALIPKEVVQEAETNELIDKIYDGSADKLFAALLGRKKLSYLMTLFENDCFPGDEIFLLTGYIIWRILYTKIILYVI